MWLFSKSIRGYTLVEMLGTLAIIAILAVMVMPYGKLVVKRQNEFLLDRSLRTIRVAIDRFHEDWRNGKISKITKVASSDGYPVDLKLLVEGVPGKELTSVPIKYLRRIPADPFAPAGISPEDQWQYIGYRDKPDTNYWNKEDVYDIRSKSQATSINGSGYRDW